MHKKFLVIGASGYIGSYFLQNILKTTSSEIIATHTQNSSPSIVNDRIKWMHLDVTDFAAVDAFCAELEKSGAKFNVIYLSAFHHPDKVEQTPKLAWNINIVALSNIINKLPNISTFYYSSTDSVYGESVDNYHFTEEDAHHPLNEYGRQKSLAEQIVLSYRHNVIHYPFLIGTSLTHKKHFYDVIVDDLKAGKKVEAFCDSYRSSIDFNSASLYCLQLIEKFGEENIGAVNICSDAALSKEDVILQIAKKHGFSADNVVPISAQKMNNIFVAKRANSTLMSNSKMKQLLSLTSVELVIL
jgi:dTDP-4-dehydrorhamnose reductase